MTFYVSYAWRRFWLRATVPALAADEILDAIDQARKAYQAGDMANAKQSLDLASQLIGQKNAEAFVALLPAPLPGWKAEKAQSHAVGAALLGGASAASRAYTNAKGDNVEVSITGDSALLMQFTPMLNNPAMAGVMGKLIRIGDQRAIQNADGDVIMVIANKIPGQCARFGRRGREAVLRAGGRRRQAVEDVADANQCGAAISR